MEWRCPICLTDDGYPYFIGCSHSVCNICLGYIENCPLCRNQITTVCPNIDLGTLIGKTHETDTTDVKDIKLDYINQIIHTLRTAKNMIISRDREHFQRMDEAEDRRWIEHFYYKINA